MIHCFVKPIVWKSTTNLGKRALSVLVCCFFVVAGLLITSDVHALHESGIYALHKWDRVVLQNVGKDGLRVRNQAGIDTSERPPVVHNGTRGTVLKGPVRDTESGPPGTDIKYTWYKVKWDTANGELTGWTADVIDGCPTYIISAERADQRDAIAFKLFGYDRPEFDYEIHDVDRLTLHDYNDYGCYPNWGKYDARGHAGLDVQTRNKSKNQVFYSLTAGIVTIAGFTDKNKNGTEDKGETDPYKTIAIYDPDKNMTTLYLHASSVDPSIEEGIRIKQGTPLGKQGDTGSSRAIHVHLEVQLGRSRQPYPVKGSLKLEDPIKYLYEWVTEFDEPSCDVNDDGKINIIDFLLVWLHRGKDVKDSPKYDVNNDGVIDNDDVIEVIKNFDALAAPSIATHETPENNALFPNYPNPFNPETWIPYKLATPADVRISIYTVDGKLVRLLALGHKPVGIYRSRSRAAYWDGKNALGESVR